MQKTTKISSKSVLLKLRELLEQNNLYNNKLKSELDVIIQDLDDLGKYQVWIDNICRKLSKELACEDCKFYSATLCPCKKEECYKQLKTAITKEIKK